MLKHLKLRTIFFSADQGGSTGTDAAPQTLAQATAALAEAKETARGLQEAKAAAEANVASLTAELASLKAENAKLAEQFAAAEAVAVKAKVDLATAQAQLATITEDRDAKATALETASANVGRLERLCSLRGVDPKAAVPAQPRGSGDSGIYDQWMRATGAEKTKLWRENESAIRAEAMRRAAAHI